MSSCRGKFVTMVAVFLAVLAAGACIALAAGSKSHTQISIPLQNGRLNCRDVIFEACEALNLAPPKGVDEVTWSIDVQSFLGRVQLNLFDRLAAGVIDTRAEPNQIVVTIDREKLTKKLHETGS